MTCFRVFVNILLDESVPRVPRFHEILNGQVQVAQVLSGATPEGQNPRRVGFGLARLGFSFIEIIIHIFC